MTATVKQPKKKRKLKKGVAIDPLDDRVIVRIDDPEEMSEGGIILPAAAQEQSQLATVCAVGPGKPWPEYVIAPEEMVAHYQKLEGSPLQGLEALQVLQPRYPMTVKEGDRVIIGRFAGSPLEYEAEKYTIVRESDILAVVHNPAD